MVENASSSKLTVTFWALYPEFSVHVEIFGMICHETRLYKLITHGTLQLTVGILVQARSSLGPSLLGLLGLDRGARGRR